VSVSLTLCCVSSINLYACRLQILFIYQFSLCHKTLCLTNFLTYLSTYILTFFYLLTYLVPSKPGDPSYVNSTEDSLTISWKQSGFADNYTIEYNNTKTSPSISMVGVGDGDSMVSATVTGLATPGALYCLTVAAVSGHLQSQQSGILCSYIGKSPSLLF